MSLCVHVGIQVGGSFANGPKQGLQAEGAQRGPVLVGTFFTLALIAQWTSSVSVSTLV